MARLVHRARPRLLHALLLLCSCLGSCGISPNPTPPVLFLVAYEEPNNDFVIALYDPVTIAQARAIVLGQERLTIRVQGNIVLGAIDYNSPWSFHLDPDTISFFYEAYEICDAATWYVEANLNEVGDEILPGRQWCPWKSRVVAELSK
jgi:hypothetical protein